MEERGRTRLTSGVWSRALDRDDAMAHRLLERAIRALGAGIASAVNLLDVEAVIIGGGLGLRLGQPYVDRIREAMMPHLFANDRPPAVELAALGDLGGAIGAALLVKAAGARARVSLLARADTSSRPPTRSRTRCWPRRSPRRSAARRCVRPSRPAR